MNKQLLHMQKLAGLITESEYNKLVTENSLKDKIKELIHSSLGEAKKKKDEEEDVAPQEDMPEDTLEPTDVDMDMDMSTDADVDTGIDIDPKVKNIQNLLQKAYANAKSLGDEKLMTQIGNTITMVVRNQVLGGQAVAESLNEEANQAMVAKYLNLLNDLVQQYAAGDINDTINLEAAVEIFHNRLKKEIASSGIDEENA